jgi:hypothetical protein
MKSRRLIMLTLAVILASVTMAQELIQYPASSLVLKIKERGGKNGAAVVYNPVARMYYCVMGGNAEYPLETYDENGKNIYQSMAYSDMRGMWWNPKEKALEGNCYNDGGIVSIGLTANGHAGKGNKVIFAGSGHQPHEHAVGTMDSKGKEILYYEDGRVIGYSRKDGQPSGTYLILSLPVSKDDLNWTTMIFTGVKNMEIGLLDVNAGKVYLFSKKDGSHTGTANLPRSVTLYDGFNFSYANNYVFLFDQDARQWVGYKIF